jgi:hypothetical protein
VCQECNWRTDCEMVCCCEAAVCVRSATGGVTVKWCAAVRLRCVSGVQLEE